MFTSNVFVCLQSETIRDFDSRFTSVQFGFSDVSDYYRNASLHDKMHTVRVPFLGLAALDDPFQPIEGEQPLRNYQPTTNVLMTNYMLTKYR